MDDKHLAYLFVRTSMGLSMFIHGFVRLGSNFETFVSKLLMQFANTIIPAPLVKIHASIIPYAEFSIGVFLLLGLFTRVNLVLALLLMHTLMVGMGLLQNWETLMSQILYVVIFSMLLFFREYNKISLDRYRSKI